MSNLGFSRSDRDEGRFLAGGERLLGNLEEKTGSPVVYSRLHWRSMKRFAGSGGVESLRGSWEVAVDLGGYGLHVLEESIKL